MSQCIQQSFIDAPVEVVWELISDVDHHDEWWPRVVQADCDQVEEGCTYKEVVKTSRFSQGELEVVVEALKDCEEFQIRCVNTGFLIRFALTAAQDGTFVEGEMGVEPLDLKTRVFDVVAGKRFFRTWLDESMAAIEQIAKSRAASA